MKKAFKIDNDLIEKMIKEARLASKNAFVPYNKHGFGSSVLAYDNTIYSGCNVENSISGLGTCSEISAINNAVVNGRYKLKALCLYDSLPQYSYPCGVCRQYISQFCLITGRDITIILSSSLGHKITSFLKIFPNGHYDRSNNKDILSYAQKDLSS